MTTSLPGDAGVPGSLQRVLSEVAAERQSQDQRWGVQPLPDGTGPAHLPAAESARAECAQVFRAGAGTFRHVLAEEVAEAFAETDPALLRAELIQVAAVAVKWIQALDRRSPLPPS